MSAIFAIRGGWGCARILPLLDWDTIRRNPKVVTGYSDVTAPPLRPAGAQPAS